jgi:hypothetical protein
MTMMSDVRGLIGAGLAAALMAAAPAEGQQALPVITRLVVEPSTITIKAGESVALRVTAFDARGVVVPEAPIRVSGPRGAIQYDAETKRLRALKAGTYDLAVSLASRDLGSPAPLLLSVKVDWPSLAAIRIAPTEPGRLYTNVTIGHRAKGLHADQSERIGFSPTWRSSAPAVATVNQYGDVTAVRPGPVTITAEAEGVTGRVDYTVLANPVTSIEIGIERTAIRTGDAIPLVATARAANGAPVPDAPITWSYTYTPDDSIAAPGGAGIIDAGLFAANYPGRYGLIAQAGSASARTVVAVSPRGVRQRITITGRGNISHTHTSDLWPWTGIDGRDYCLVGTWGADGWALVFDITDLNNIVKTDSIRIDARTINDVTVSPSGRYGALSREGASNRVNGVVILDLSTPAHPKIASVFDRELTGGVHNMFATDDHLFAISGGQKYVIIDMKDITKPTYLSEYRHPNARIHDLWVHDGIAYSAQGGVGAVAVDVGNGKYGGTIEKPKLINVFPSTSGHEIYPYFQKKTGKVYLFLGDEETRTGRVWEGTTEEPAGPGGKPFKGGIAQTMGGYTHIVDFTDPMNPRKVARYQIEDFGSHDIIVEDDVMYQAYYEGGVRIVDVSGPLLGNLFDQGREIAVFKPFDPQGYTANAPMAMNAMPWKGRVLFTDFNSGLWAAKLEPRQRLTP